MKYTFSIKKNNVFKYVLRKGTYSIGQYLVVHIDNQNKRIKSNFLGICVSKKNGISVHRNKMKRWVREVFKDEESKLKLGYNIVVLYKKTTTIDMLDFSKVQNDLLKCFRKLDIYEKE